MSEKFNSQKRKNDRNNPNSTHANSTGPSRKKTGKPTSDKSKNDGARRGGKSGSVESDPAKSRGDNKARPTGSRTDNARSDSRIEKPRGDRKGPAAGRSGQSATGQPRTDKPRGEKPRGSKPKSDPLFAKKNNLDKNIDADQAEDEVKYVKPSNALDSVDGQSEKLQKVLARAGHGSRREVEAMIQQGRISVDGKISTLGDRVEMHAGTKIRLDGHVLSIIESQDTVCRVLAYYKPEGELCTRSDPEGRPTVFDRLPKMRGSRWVAVGRLDVNTSGLLLFTTDGELANRLMHPSREVEREYAVRVFGQIDDEKIKQLSRGVQLEDGPAAFRTIKYQGGEGLNQWYNVTLTEGRNREVRRLWEAVGVQVSRLIRVRYGDLNLPKGLPRGGYTELDLPEINYLRTLVEMNEETVSKLPVERDRRRVKANQIRRAVKRHTQVAPARRGNSTKRG